MVDAQSPQQALRAYSNAKEYAYGILCDARHGESNKQDRGLIPPCERYASPTPEPPQGQHRDGSASQPLASHTRYRSGAPTPCRDESRLGHNPISTLSNSGMPRSAPSVRSGMPRSATIGAGGGAARGGRLTTKHPAQVLDRLGGPDRLPDRSRIRACGGQFAGTGGRAELFGGGEQGEPRDRGHGPRHPGVDAGGRDLAPVRGRAVGARGAGAAGVADVLWRNRR